jgi:hypothetical protein
MTNDYVNVEKSSKKLGMSSTKSFLKCCRFAKTLFIVAIHLLQNILERGLRNVTKIISFSLTIAKVLLLLLVTIFLNCQISLVTY